MDDSKLRYFASAWLISITLPADSAERYNAQFVNGIDPLAFNQFVASDGDVMPGTYDVNIYINDLLVDSRPVRFSEDSAHGGLAPCLSAAEYIRYGVKIDDDHQPCFALSQTIRQAEQQLDIANHQLIIHIPQQYIEHYPRDYVSPMRFDEGINAAFVNYSYSTDANNGDGGSHQYQYLSLNSGINIASWRLRNNAYWNKFSGQADKWQSIASWAETNIIPWRSRLVVGQTSTDNSVFDSVQFRGVQLGTDVEMRPSSQTGFAPVIRGVANSNARVEVRQNNYLIYSENVPAGPFELNDISAVNRSGDFYVTVIEADGSQTTFTVAYTTLPQLVRAGQWNYQLSAGKYHDGADGYAPALMQSSLSYGLNNTFTLYGGALAAENYRAGAFGVGSNLGEIGALSADYTLAGTTLANGQRKQGGSVRFLYAKSFLSSKTDFQIAGYRYSTAGYYSLSDAVNERRRWHNGLYENDYWPSDEDESWQASAPQHYYTSWFYNKKHRFDISARQTLGKNSAFFLNFSQQNYWNSSGSDISLQAGFNSTIHNVNYGLYYQNTRSHFTHDDNSITLRVSIPFTLQENRRINTAFTLAHSKSSGTSGQAGVNGTLLDDGRLSWAVTSAYDDTSHSTNSASLGYLGQYGNLYTGYAYSKSHRQASLNLSGGVVAHRGGVTLSQPLGSTFALVEAKDAQGVGIENQTGVRIDPFGYAVVPQSVPYRVNSVALNPQDFDTFLDVPNAVADTVPTRGAITRVRFDTFRGYSVLIHTTLADGSYPPLGAELYRASGISNGLVGPGGDVYVSGVDSGEKLQIKWGETHQQSCEITLPELRQEPQQATAWRELSLICTVTPSR
mgnify:FL=1